MPDDNRCQNLHTNSMRCRYQRQHYGLRCLCWVDASMRESVEFGEVKRPDPPKTVEQKEPAS